MAKEMELAKLLLRLGVDASQLEKELGEADEKTRRRTESMGHAIGSFAKRAGEDFAALGGGVGALAGGITALATGTGGIEALYQGLKVAVTSAAAFEQAMIGVKKTVEGSEADYAKFGDQFQRLSGEMGISAVKIAGVAESAGQLGIQKDSILAFTKTILELDIASDLTAESGATMLAQYANVTALPVDAFDNMASTIVRLGAVGATTESQILSMMLRIGGTAATVGVAQEEIAALAATFANAGVSAELGGNSINKTLLEMNSAVISGGEQLQAFAKAAGMTAAQFAAAWKESPYLAIEAFLGGLQRLNKEGKDVALALDAAGLKGTEIAGVLLKGSVQADKMTVSLQQANVAYKEQNAHSIEAAKQLESLSSSWARFAESATNAAARVGVAFEPVLKLITDILNALQNANSVASIFLRLMPGGISASNVMTGNQSAPDNWLAEMLGVTHDLFGNPIVAGAHARGTVTSGPELALIGEAGPEAVVPLGGNPFANLAALLGVRQMAGGGTAAPSWWDPKDAIGSWQRNRVQASGNAYGGYADQIDAMSKPAASAGSSAPSAADLGAFAAAMSRIPGAIGIDTERMNREIELMEKEADQYDALWDSIDKAIDGFHGAGDAAGDFDAGLEDAAGEMGELQGSMADAAPAMESLINQTDLLDTSLSRWASKFTVEYGSNRDAMAGAASAIFIDKAALSQMFGKLPKDFANEMYLTMRQGQFGALGPQMGGSVGWFKAMTQMGDSSLKMLEVMNAVGYDFQTFDSTLAAMNGGMKSFAEMTDIAAVAGREATQRTAEVTEPYQQQIERLTASLSVLGSGAAAVGGAMSAWAGLSQLEQQMRLSEMLGGTAGMSQLEQQQALAGGGGLQAALNAMAGLGQQPFMNPFDLAAGMLAGQPAYKSNPYALQAAAMAQQPYLSPYNVAASSKQGTGDVWLQGDKVGRTQRRHERSWNGSNISGWRG